MTQAHLTSQVPDLIERVSTILRETAEEVVIPRWKALQEGDVRSKSPGELVTVADEEAEKALTARLAELAPGVPVVGEEATAADPGLPARLAEDRAWLVDPIDGTTNFVQGGDRWSLMVALVERQQVSACWIWRPPAGLMYRAERGGGAYGNDRRLQIQAAPERDGPLRGSVFTRFFPPEQGEVIRRSAAAHPEVVEGSCAGYDYPLLAEGEKDFLMFWRTLPWDHAPGTLLVAEAGALVKRIDGSEYAPAQDRFGLLPAVTLEARERALGLLADQGDSASGSAGPSST